MYKVYYPQEALEGFGKALESKLGVPIRFTTGSPHADGNTVYLPALKDPLDSTGFAAMCGVAVHECAHVLFGSPAQFQSYVGRDALKQNCYNAVLDVADETRIEQHVGSAKNLLRTMNTYAADRVAGEPFTKLDPVRQILGAAIIGTRLGLHDVWRQAQGMPIYDKVVAAYRILKKCKTRRPPGGKTPKVSRSRDQWRALEAATDKLVDLLKELPPPPSQDGPGEGAMGPAGADAQAIAGTGGQPGPGDKSADAGDGEKIAEGDQSPGDTPGSSSGRPSGKAGNKGGTGPGTGSGPVVMDQSTYTGLLPALAGPVERLARWQDADGLDDGHRSGPRLGDVTRALFDSKCFARRTAEGEKLHVAVLLDTSGSMNGISPQVRGVAQAFADCVRRMAASVHLCVFSSGIHPVADFRRRTPVDGGGTNTPAALEWAGKQLKEQNGRRVCVVITDGEPCDVDGCQSATTSLRQHSSVIGVAYTCPGAPIRSSMPRAEVIEANSPGVLAIQLAYVAQKIGGG